MRLEFWLTLTVLAAMASSARADETCDSALAEGQKLKDKQELVAARRELIKCAQESCGEAMVSVCLPILEGVEKALPSVIVVATHDGKEVFDAVLSVDGRELAGSLDGRVHPIDPGRRKFRVLPKNRALAPSETEVLVIEGEQRRKLTIELGAPPGQCVGAECTRRPGRVESGAPRPAFIAGAVIGSTALACWGLFAGFGAYGLTRESEDLIVGGSTQQAIDDVKQLYVVADGFLVAASVLSAASLTAIIVGAAGGPDSAERAGAPRLQVGMLRADVVVSF